MKSKAEILKPETLKTEIGNQPPSPRLRRAKELKPKPISLYLGCSRIARPL